MIRGAVMRKKRDRSDSGPNRQGARLAAAPESEAALTAQWPARGLPRNSLTTDQPPLRIATKGLMSPKDPCP